MKNTISEPYRITEKDWSKFKDFIIRSRTDIPYAYGDGLEKVMQQPDLYWIEGIKNKQVFVIDNGENGVSHHFFFVIEDLYAGVGAIEYVVYLSTDVYPVDSWHNIILT